MKYELDIVHYCNNGFKVFQSQVITEGYTDTGEGFTTKEEAYKDGEKRICKALRRDFIEKHMSVIKMMESHLRLSILEDDDEMFHYIITFNEKKIQGKSIADIYDAYFEGVEKVNELLKGVFD